MVKGDRQAWKASYLEKARALLTQYDRIFICDADNVSSRQFQVELNLVKPLNILYIFRTFASACVVTAMF